jgi:hypothetical protein
MVHNDGDVERPIALILPQISTTVRNTQLKAEVGTLIYNSTTNKLNYCKTAAVTAGSWEALTSA